MKLVPRLTALSVGLILVSGCSVQPGPTTNESTGSSSLPLIGAPLDTTNTWSIGICPTPLITADGGAPTGTEMGNCLQPGSCTGTLVAPNLIITARHCVQGNPTMAGDLAAMCTDETKNYFPSGIPDPTNLRVTTSSSVRVGMPVWRKAKAVFLPSGVNACSDDVALIQLGENVPASEAKPASADIFTDIATNKPSSVAIVGRGVLDLQFDLDAGGIVKLDRGDYQRRILQNIPFVCASNTDGDCKLEDHFLSAAGVIKAIIAQPKGMFIFGKGGGPGDSGSGLLDQTRFTGGLPVILGVLSYGQTLADGTLGAAAAPRLAPHKDLISKAAIDSATAGGYAVPDWVAAAPALPTAIDDGGLDPDAQSDGGGGGGGGGGGTDSGTTPVTPPSSGGEDDGGCSTTNGPSGGTGAIAIAAAALGAVLIGRRRQRSRA